MQWKKINEKDEAVYHASQAVIYIRPIGNPVSMPYTVSEFEELADDGITIDDLPTVT